MRRMRGIRSGSIVACLLPLASALAAPEPRGGPGIEDALKAHVAYLAGPELKGRGAWEDRKKAADYVAKGFEAAGFRPLPGRASYFVDHGGTAAAPEVRNVCAWWPAPPKTADAVGEYVIVSAHYDHLGVRDGQVHPGADDNASGVAVLLEAAKAFTGREALVLRAKPLARALCIVAFDQEENDLKGSRAFVADPPVPLAKCSLFLTMDQMGRSLADLHAGLLFLMGGEHCPWLERTVTNLTVDSRVRTAVLGIDFQPPTGYSDYVPFQERKIPFLFVSTGACTDYHRPGDTPEKLDYALMAAHVAWLRDLVTLALATEEPLAWREDAPPRLQEIETVLWIVQQAQPRLTEMNAPDPVRLIVANYRTTLEQIVARGTVTAAERTMVRNTARLLFVQAVALMNQAPTAPR